MLRWMAIISVVSGEAASAAAVFPSRLLLEGAHALSLFLCESVEWVARSARLSSSALDWEARNEMMRRWLERAAAVWLLLHLLMRGEGLVDDEDVPMTTQQFNFASHTAGAVIIDKSPPDARGFNNLLNDDKDKYGLCTCSQKKWVVIGLAEDIVITSVTIANYEKYSSMLKTFQLHASTSYPTNEWIDLGTYTAEPRLGEQSFNLTTKTDVHTRFLKFKFLTHYLDEALCTLSQIKVYGVTVIASLKEEVEMSRDHLQLLRNDEDRNAPEVLLGNLLLPANGLEAAPFADGLATLGSTAINTSGSSPDIDASTSARPEESLSTEEVLNGSVEGGLPLVPSGEASSTLNTELRPPREEERQGLGLESVEQSNTSSEARDMPSFRGTVAEPEDSNEKPQLASPEEVHDSGQAVDVENSIASHEIDATVRNSLSASAGSSSPSATAIVAEPAAAEALLGTEAGDTLPATVEAATSLSSLHANGVSSADGEASPTSLAGSAEDSAISPSSIESDGSSHSATGTANTGPSPDTNEGSEATLPREPSGAGEDERNRDPLSLLSSFLEPANHSKAGAASASVGTAATSTSPPEVLAQVPADFPRQIEELRSEPEPSERMMGEQNQSNGSSALPEASTAGLIDASHSTLSTPQEGMDNTSSAEAPLTEAAPLEVLALEATHSTAAASSASSTPPVAGAQSVGPVGSLTRDGSTVSSVMDSAREEGAAAMLSDSDEGRPVGLDSASSTDSSSGTSSTTSSSLDTAASDNSSSSPSSSGLSLQTCIEHIRFLDFQDKMLAKLNAKREDPVASSTSSVSWKESSSSNVFRQLIQRIKALETNYVIAEAYITQMSDCMRWMSKDMARLQAIVAEGGGNDSAVQRRRRFHASEGVGQGNITIFRVVETAETEALGGAAGRGTKNQDRSSSTRQDSQLQSHSSQVAWPSSQPTWLEQWLEGVRVYTQPRPGFHDASSPEISSPALLYRRVVEKYWVEVLMALVAVVVVWSGVSVLVVGYLLTRKRK